MSGRIPVGGDGTCAKLWGVPLPEYESSPEEVRRFALLQVGLTGGFMALIFLALGGLDADLPPWWLVGALLALVVVAGVLSERVWLQSSPLDPSTDPEELERQAVGVFAAQTVRKLMFCEGAVLVAILVSFVGSWGGWLILLVGVPGLLLLAFETWPSLRNLTTTEAMLEADGAETRLVEGFRAA
jgi:hypothetical protein